ncbi:amino acid permease, partial [Micromonospora sp. D75]|nr:amino acid permease [Micromonospora sp. D75]
AWVVVLAVPLLVLLFRRIHGHYDRLHRALALHSPPSAPPAECDELPQQVRHLVVVPVARLNRASLRALAYATSLGRPTLAVHLAPAQDEADRIRDQWRGWGDHLKLETNVSPYRSVIGPLAHYLEALHAASPDLTLTVIVPEVVLRRRRYRLLHSRAEQRLRTALRALPGVVVTSVPVHVSR